MPRILCDRDRKTLNCQIHSRLSVRVLLPVESSLPAAVAAGLGGVAVVIGGSYRIAMVGQKINFNYLEKKRKQPRGWKKGEGGCVRK